MTSAGTVPIKPNPSIGLQDQLSPVSSTDFNPCHHVLESNSQGREIGDVLLYRKEGGCCCHGLPQKESQKRTCLFYAWIFDMLTCPIGEIVLWLRCHIRSLRSLWTESSMYPIFPDIPGHSFSTNIGRLSMLPNVLLDLCTCTSEVFQCHLTLPC